MSKLTKIFSCAYIDLNEVIGIQIDADSDISIRTKDTAVYIRPRDYTAFGLSTEQALDHIAEIVNASREF
jgi:hypothetical protein